LNNYKVNLTVLALKDLALIRDFIKFNSGSTIVAERVANRIVDRCERIGRIPFGGRPHGDTEPMVRTVPFEDKAVIAYRVVGPDVDILRIFYGGRDWGSILDKMRRDET
jgi:toxin ParE1/3/4